MQVSFGSVERDRLRTQLFNLMNNNSSKSHKCKTAASATEGNDSAVVKNCMQDMQDSRQKEIRILSKIHQKLLELKSAAGVTTTTSGSDETQPSANVSRVVINHEEIIRADDEGSDD